jgi:hypothetical protein
VSRPPKHTKDKKRFNDETKTEEMIVRIVITIKRNKKSTYLPTISRKQGRTGKEKKNPARTVVIIKCSRDAFPPTPTQCKWRVEGRGATHVLVYLIFPSMNARLRWEASAFPSNEGRAKEGENDIKH